MKHNFFYYFRFFQALHFKINSSVINKLKIYYQQFLCRGINSTINCDEKDF